MKKKYSISCLVIALMWVAFIVIDVVRHDWRWLPWDVMLSVILFIIAH